MSRNIEDLQRLVAKHFDYDGREIECTVPSCDTCLHESERSVDCNLLEDKSACDRFIPISWKDHILIDGKWWS